MTYSTNPRDDYANQGQQDDYFDQDLAIAGHDRQVHTQQDNQETEDYQNQGQQDDYFNQDLSQGDRPQP